MILISVTNQDYNTEMVTTLNIKRRLTIDLPQGQSAFLWGARKTGKSTFLHQHFPNAIYYDLLKSDEHTRLLAQPHLLREDLLADKEKAITDGVIIDEVQKIPALLDEVHWLIENAGVGFILCGSSARKLKRGAANLLGGRAWRFDFYPLTYEEIPDFDLLRAFNHGLIPSHYLSDQPKRMLRAYIGDYLKEEIQAEGLVRNLPGFARFLDAIGFSHGEMINYTNIARECAIDAKSVKEYFQILEDTLIGYLIRPYAKQPKRQLITATPKFYLFDTGIANHLKQTPISSLRGTEAGKSLEHFILMELKAFNGLNELDFPITYWRSKTGLEVDFILGQADVAIEIKISKDPSGKDLNGLVAFCQDYQPKHAIVVCQATRPRTIKINEQTNIVVLPWQMFLEQLWQRKFI